MGKEHFGQVELFPSNVYRFYEHLSVDYDSGPRVRRLWLAVLQRALQDYVQAKQRGEVDEEVLAWFSEGDSEELGSYSSICKLLDIDADRLLGRLEDISEEGLRGLRKSGLDDVY